MTDYMYVCALLQSEDSYPASAQPCTSYCRLPSALLLYALESYRCGGYLEVPPNIEWSAPKADHIRVPRHDQPPALFSDIIRAYEKKHNKQEKKTKTKNQAQAAVPDLLSRSLLLHPPGSLV